MEQGNKGRKRKSNENNDDEKERRKKYIKIFEAVRNFFFEYVYGKFFVCFFF